ncbi:hypothetical protein [Acinetobacter sp. Marseille-Q1623]|uniref:hypothetical protein n=1 Tax=Acinetobacter sp. Marseille-Q1623 TaxID=2697501 RepID=UPI00157B5C6C|nr:hypothetical protein [Acinetobacter sp. Marseille-Q1623]
MIDSQENEADINFIIQFIMCCIVAIVFLTSTYREFSSFAQFQHKLKNKNWVQKTMEITPQMEIEIFHYRNHQSKIIFKENQQEIFSKSCNGQLELICKFIENHEIQIISLNFYTFLEKNTNNYNEFLLNTIAFKDKQGQLQTFPYMTDAPNSPQYIAEIKTEFRSFFIFAFLKHLIFAIMFLGFNLSFNVFKKSTIKLINYLIITTFSLSFISFVIRYFLI